LGKRRDRPPLAQISLVGLWRGFLCVSVVVANQSEGAQIARNGLTVVSNLLPERKLAMTWTFRRNTDKGLPATHTVEIMFELPADFPAGGISNVPGILMKQVEQTRCTLISPADYEGD
jgi:hypothetical protein